MAQHDYVIANGTGAAVRSDLNTALAAIVSLNSGATAPSTTYAYMLWADTSAGLLKIRNGANSAWVTVGTLDTANLGFLATGSTFAAALGSASTPGLTFTGDLNTGIFSPGSDRVSIATGGSARIEADASGRILIGTASPRTNVRFGANNETPLIQIESAVDDYTGAGMSIINNSASGFAPSLWIGRSGSTTLGSNTIFPGSPEAMGHLSFVANDGTNFIQAARITASIDGTVGTGDMPSSMQFLTTQDGASTLTEAMRINREQELLIGYTSDNGSYKLQVNSQIFATSSTIATSDARYKENVATLNGCFDLVKSLRPVSFTWKPQQPVTKLDDNGDEILIREAHNFPSGEQVGFIAQEIQEVLADKPWLGSIIKENTRPAITDADGTELAPEEQFYGIAEGNLIAVLTSALQETIGRVEALEATLANMT
jgi:hypothetical protein